VTVREALLFLDSADTGEAREAAAAGYVAGITTNPLLMRRSTLEPLARLRELLDAFPDGRVFYQPTSANERHAEAEAHRALALGAERVVIKLPAREPLVRLAARLTKAGGATALTAVFSAGQAVLAAAAGCAFVIPYVDRAERHPAGGHDVVRRLAATIERSGTPVRILAASIKSAGQAIAALEAGAHAVTAPLAVLRALAAHPMTEEAVEEFESAFADRDRLETVAT
jgi:transaldolase